MPTDDIVWNPRVGTVGDQKYDFPGSTTLAGSVDPGSPTRIDAGSTALGVNPSFGTLQGATAITMNQIIGLINNRITAINTAQALAQPTSTYANAVPLDKVSIQTFILNLRSQIDFIRLREGSTAFTWDSDFTALGTSTLTTIKGYHLAEMRKALQRFLNVQNFADTFNFNAPTTSANRWPKNITVSGTCAAARLFHWDTTALAIVEDTETVYTQGYACTGPGLGGYAGTGQPAPGTGSPPGYCSISNLSPFQLFSIVRFYTSVRVLPINVNPFTNSSSTNLLISNVGGPDGVALSYRVQSGASNTTAITKSGNFVFGSPTISGVPGVTPTSPSINDLISGPGIPPGAYVVSRTVGGTITMNVPATAAGTGVSFTIGHFTDPTLACTNANIPSIYDGTGFTSLGTFSAGGPYTVSFINVTQNDVIEFHSQIPSSATELAQIFYNGASHFHANDLLGTGLGSGGGGTLTLQVFY